MAMEVQLATGKECGTCAMCCKVYEFTDLKKTPKGWCENFKVGTGCSIYPDRPSQCRAFYCNWILVESLGPEWKPSICKFVMTYDISRSILIQVDPSFPTAWRQKPYEQQIHEWAKFLKAEGRFIFILVGKNLTVITAEGEYNLGIYDQGYEVKFRSEIQQGVSIQIPYKAPLATH